MSFPSKQFFPSKQNCYLPYAPGALWGSRMLVTYIFIPLGRMGPFRGWRELCSLSESHSLCLTLCDPHGLYSPLNSPGQNTGEGSLSLLRDLPDPGNEPGFPALQADSLPAELPRASLVAS